MNIRQFVEEHYRGFGDTGGLASLDINRTFDVITLLDRTRDVEGDVVECGVWKGGTAYVIAKYLEKFCPHKWLRLYDTFAGMPFTGKNDTHGIGDFKDTNVEDVADLLSFYPYVLFYPGVFPAPLDVSALRRCSFVHADMDQEESTRSIIEVFWPVMALDGIIAFDDYYNDSCRGVKIAVDEAFVTDCVGAIQYAVNS